MHQPEQSNLPDSHPAIQSPTTIELQTAPDGTTENIREWLPEDEDDWYEPDYCRSDRLS